MSKFLINSDEKPIDIPPGYEANPREPNDIERLAIYPGHKLVVGTAFQKIRMNGVEYAAPLDEFSTIEDVYGIVADDGEPVIDNPFGLLDLDGEPIKIKIATTQIRAFTFNSKMSCGILYSFATTADPELLEQDDYLLYVIKSRSENDLGIVGSFIVAAADESDDLLEDEGVILLPKTQNKMRPFKNSFYFEHTNIGFGV